MLSFYFNLPFAASQPLSPNHSLSLKISWTCTDFVNITILKQDHFTLIFNETQPWIQSNRNESSFMKASYSSSVSTIFLNWKWFEYDTQRLYIKLTFRHLVGLIVITWITKSLSLSMPVWFRSNEINESLVLVLLKLPIANNVINTKIIVEIAQNNHVLFSIV